MTERDESLNFLRTVLESFRKVSLNKAAFEDVQLLDQALEHLKKIENGK